MKPAVSTEDTHVRELQLLILHIPHAAAKIPFLDGFTDLEKTNELIQILTDWYTDELFDDEKSIQVIAAFSRVFCDVERFKDDALEKMSEKGMGVIYTKDDDGDLIRNINKQIRDKIIKEYYEPHHDSLNKQVEMQLNSHGFAKIIDCHSYPDYPLKMDIDQSLPRPDFNIGIDQFHTPSDWISHSKVFFESRNYSLGIDWPYSGTIVPMEYYKTEPNVRSIMLEVNRRLYLKPNSIEKNEKFMKTKKVVLDWLELINSL